MANKEGCHGQKIISILKQQMLNNTTKKIPVFLDRCNSTTNSTNKESDTDVETNTDSNFSSMGFNSHVDFQKERELDFVTDLNVVREQIETNQ